MELYSITRDRTGRVNLEVSLHEVQKIVWDIWINNKLPEGIEKVSKEILLSAGSGGGKSSFGVILVYKMAQLIKLAKGEGSIIITAPDYSMLEGIIVDKFVYLFQDVLKLGRFSGAPKMRFSFTGKLDGIKVYFRNSSNPHSIEGIHADFIWADEIGYYSKDVRVSKKSYSVMQDRVRAKSGLILMTTTPYVKNWVYRDVVRPANKIIYTVKDEDIFRAYKEKNLQVLRDNLEVRFEKGEHDDKLCIIYPSFINPTYPEEDFLKAIRDWEFEDFKMRFLGLWIDTTPQVLSKFTEDNIIEPFTIKDEEKHNWRLFLGIDFGYRDPFVCVFILKSPDNKYYVIDEYINNQVDNEEHAKRIVQRYTHLQKIYNLPDIECAYADLTGSMRDYDKGQNVINLQEGLKKYGFDINFRPPYAQLLHTVSIINGLLGSKRLLISTTCEETLDEVYEWREIGGKNQRDHCWDAIRYVVATLEKTEGRQIEDVIIDGEEKQEERRDSLSLGDMERLSKILAKLNRGTLKRLEVE